MRFERLRSREQVREFIQRYNECGNGFIVIDCESTSSNPRTAQLLDIQLSGIEDEHAVIFQGDYAEYLVELAPHIVLVGHHSKYDAHLLYKHGIDLLDRTWRCTLLLAHLCDENRESYSLDAFVKEYWNDPYKEVFWTKYDAYKDATEEEQIEYACKDVVYTGRLYRRLLASIDVPESLIEHVHRLQASLLRTEIQGIKVDLPYLTDLGIKLKSEIERLKPLMRSQVELQCELWEMQQYERELQKRKTPKGKSNTPRPEFSFDSATQLKSLLYEQLGLPEQVNEKTKRPTTDDGALEKLKELHPVVLLIQEYRQNQKVYTSFIEGTRERIEDGRIYPEFRVAGTVTGRIAHSNPNLGQLPRSGGVRGVYIPDSGKCLLSADYSQLEVCIEANLTGDSSLQRIFTEGLSKHDITARELRIDRHTAKTLNFALQYWASHYKVAKLLGVSEREGKEIWERYWALYRGPKNLKATTDAAVDSGRPIKTAFGRRRRFAVRNRSAWDADYRQAYNFLIQGTGADITSRAFYLVSEEFRRRNYGRGLFTVHDELIVEVKEGVAGEAEALMLETMIKVGTELGLKIPLRAESSGPTLRWED